MMTLQTWSWEGQKKKKS